MNTTKTRVNSFLYQPTLNRPALVAARLSAELAEALDRERRRRGVPKSEVIFLALQEFLARN